MNRIQLQKRLPVAQFMHQYGTAAKRRLLLYDACWLNGLRRPACEELRGWISQRGAHSIYQCWACGQQKTNTNLAAMRRTRHLGVRYRITWHVMHNIMTAMAERAERRRIGRFVQADDANLVANLNQSKVMAVWRTSKCSRRRWRSTRLWDTRGFRYWDSDVPSTMLPTPNPLRFSRRVCCRALSGTSGFKRAPRDISPRDVSLLNFALTGNFKRISYENL